MKTPRQRPVGSCLMLTGKLKQFVSDAVANDCVSLWDHDAGTVVVTDGDAKVLSAIQKGRQQPWIVMFFNSDRITWSNP